MMSNAWTRLGLIGTMAATACAASTAFVGTDPTPSPSVDGGGPTDGNVSFGDGGLPDSSTLSSDAGIYANTFTELYRFDPVSQKLTLIAPFTGCNDQLGTPTVWDIAIDSLGNCYATTSVGLWKVDLTTAVCTKVAGGMVGSYPPSENMTFVPKGTLDPSADTLVGYVSGGANPPTTVNPNWNSTYARVGFSPYSVTYSGILGWEDLFDVVSVMDGGTFALGHQSAYYADCQENCLIQVKPSDGTELQHYGVIPFNNGYAIQGLAYWAGIIYAFDNGGGVSSIEWKGTTMTVTDIPVQPTNLSFMGAGSTTSAPALTPDGGGPPLN